MDINAMWKTNAQVMHRCILLGRSYLKGGITENMRAIYSREIQQGL